MALAPSIGIPVEVSGGDRRRGVLGHIERSAGTAPIAGFDRGIVIDLRDSHRQGLGGGLAAVGDLHGDVIDIVGTDVGGALVVRAPWQGQGAGGAIDTELGRVGAAGEGGL